MNLLIDGPKIPLATFILAHGAGAKRDSDWMNELTLNLAQHSIQVIRFNFPYMEERIKLGTRRPPK